MDHIFAYCIKKIYSILIHEYGPQGWWPLLAAQQAPAKKTWSGGYHPGDYSFPRDEFQNFEIWVGTILTQNTNWSNASRALRNLDERDLLLAENLMKADPRVISETIRSSGYYNQKTRRLQRVAGQFTRLRSRKPTRRELLGIEGIGPETADSILLYAYHRPCFVVDSYSRRIVNRVFGVQLKKYGDVADLFYRSYRKTGLDERVRIFGEYHALLVRHAKAFCQRTPRCDGCGLRFLCRTG